MVAVDGRDYSECALGQSFHLSAIGAESINNWRRVDTPLHFSTSDAGINGKTVAAIKTGDRVAVGRPYDLMQSQTQTTKIFQRAV